MEPVYKRVMVKISGEALGGDGAQNMDPDAVQFIGSQIASLHKAGVQTAVMVGGGNIFRGSSSDQWGIDRVDADFIGMLGTAVNAVVLRGTLQRMLDTDRIPLMVSLDMQDIGEPYIRSKALARLASYGILLLACGTGQPYVTTDYPAVQRALELDAEALLVAKNGVDGVYAADPRRDPDAVRYDHLSYDDVLKQGLMVMDQTAFALARDNALPIHVVSIGESGALLRAAEGEAIGTTISVDGASRLAGQPAAGA
jgi:uridylate kinase